MAVSSSAEAGLRPGEGVSDPQLTADDMFRHELILYGDTEKGFVSQTAPMAGMRSEGEAPMLVATPPHRMSNREAIAAPFDGRLEPPPPGAEAMDFDEGDLPALRHAVTAWADRQQLETESIEELVLAVDEIASNSIRYGGGGGTLRMWREPGRLLCEVADRGHIRDPLLGRLQPGPDALSGRGLWIVNHLCDLVQIRSSARGSQVRLHKRLA